MIEDKGHQERPISRVANKNWRDNFDGIFKKTPNNPKNKAPNAPNAEKDK